MTKYSGSCLCKAVAFAIDGEFSGFFLCHCTRCRKTSGSVHGANLFSSTAELTWISGRAGVKTFRFPNSRFARSFCEACGSALPTEEKRGIVVPAGSLDCDVALKPNAHIFMGSKANWDVELERIDKHDTLPQIIP